ncbi:SymE family type I addiction module toxin [Erwinia sp. P7711]|uniref:SymE family type I addiction module toxin n=1 Tax=Erwinia sp. P7711 TaxID=3141451 RepID=UPI003192ABF0
MPSLAMKDKWLAEAGFDAGRVADVRVMKGCLVLTARPPEPEEPELMKSLRLVCKFSAHKQRQVQAFIKIVGARGGRG